MQLFCHYIELGISWAFKPVTGFEPAQREHIYISLRPALKPSGHRMVREQWIDEWMYSNFFMLHLVYKVKTCMELS